MVDLLEFTGNQKCIESLDNILQDIISDITKGDYRSSGELVDLKGCSWTLHERYHMDGEDQLFRFAGEQFVNQKLNEKGPETETNK